jgi:multidrug efflux system outer membrane protein
MTRTLTRSAVLVALLAAPAAAQTPARGFFDSLSARRPAGGAAPLALAADSGSAIAWLDLLKDPVLVALVREAVSSSPDIRLAQSRVREYRAEAGVASSARYPLIEANASAGTQQTVFGTLGAFGFEAYRATADLSWELDFWGRLGKGARGAQMDLAAEREESRATVLSLVSDIATAYLELREVDQQLAVAERTLASRRSTLSLAERRLAEGVISELDVRQFEAEVAGPAARVAEFTRTRARKEHQLSRLVGRTPGPIARGLPLAEVARAVTVPDSVSSLLIGRRPDVLKAEREIDAAEARESAAKAARLPRFLVTGNYGTQAMEPGDMFAKNSEVYALQGGISIPLTQGRVKQQQEAAAARAEQARIRHERTVLVALGEVSDALIGVRSSRDQLLAQEVQVRALRRAQELAERRYDAGISSYLEVLDSQRGLFNAEIALSQAEREYLVSAVALYRALGGSWEEK